MIGTTAALIMGGLAAGGALGGAAIQSSAAKGAAKTQAEAADRAAQISLEQGEKAAALQDPAAREANALLDQVTSPYRVAGEGALQQLVQLLAPGGDLNRNFTREDFQVDPGFQFRQEQGEQAVNRSLAARGGVLSGEAVKEAMRFNSGLASQEYAAAFDRFRQQNADRFGRLSSVAGSGQNAAQFFGGTAADNIIGSATRQGQFLTNAGQQQGSYLTQGANAQAAGQVGSANAISSGISGGLNSLQQMYLLSQLSKASNPTSKIGVA